jgi:hypothetical protein
MNLDYGGWVWKTLSACDRALEGRSGRAKNPTNEPSSAGDPIAYFSYHRCRSNPTLISALFPNQFPRANADQPKVRRSRWRFWK